MEHVHNHTGRRPLLFMSDNELGYTSKHTTEYHEDPGITALTTVPHSPQENGIAERINHTITTKARASLAASRLPAHFWTDAVRDAVYNYNVSLHQSIEDHGIKPNIAYLKAFGQPGRIPHYASNLQKLHPPCTVRPLSLPYR